MWQIEFESDQFLPQMPEEWQVNPGCYGFELAHWLSGRLTERHIATSYPLEDDWCWFLTHRYAGTEFAISCSHMGKINEGYAGKPIPWHIVIKSRRSLKQRLLGYDADADVERIGDVVIAALREHGIAPKRVRR